jgi:hypothetical protein
MKKILPIASEGSVEKNLDPWPLVISLPSLSALRVTKRSFKKVNPNVQTTPDIK